MDVGNDDSPNCYGPEFNNVTERSIIDYLETVILHDLQFPTYKWLADAGITPSNSTGVELDKMLNVLTDKSGAVPFVSHYCEDRVG
jgi:ribonuclease T2